MLNRQYHVVTNLVDGQYVALDEHVPNGPNGHGGQHDDQDDGQGGGQDGGQDDDRPNDVPDDDDVVDSVRLHS